MYSVILGRCLILQARELFTKAADANDANGHYNLGVLYLKGTGLKRDVNEARKHFLHAYSMSKVMHPKALYQIAKMQQKGIGIAKDEAMVMSFISWLAACSFVFNPSFPDGFIVESPAIKLPSSTDSSTRPGPYP